MTNILVTICARGGSKGIPGKNIKRLNGKPLIAYSIDTALKFKTEFPDADIELSSDSEDIIRISSQYGLCSKYQRPDSLAGDFVGKIETINDLLFYSENENKKKYDYILDLDVTSPLRNLEDLRNAYLLLKEDSNAENIFSVSPASRNPYFNMVEKQDNGYFAQVKKLDRDLFSRQNSPIVYDLNASFYFYRRSFFTNGFKSAITEKSLIYIIPHICFDLDHPIDFDFLDYLITNNKLDFSL